MMQNVLHRLRSQDGPASPWLAAALLLAAALVSYGLSLPHLGFYWDSWPMNWIVQTRGAAGLAQYFSTNRPVWGLLYQATTAVLGAEPLTWQIFALIWRWWAALAFWGVLRLTWPRQREPALWAALLFVVYPGFQQSSIGLLYSHFYIVMTAYLLSLACSLAALNASRQRGLWLTLGLLLAAANLFMMEYFFLLELIRPLLLWLALPALPPRTRLRRVIISWAPFAALFIGAAVWRVFLFPYQTNNYRLKTLDQFSTQPLETLWQLLRRALGQIWIAAGAAWGQTLRLPLLKSLAPSTLMKIGALAGALAAVIGLTARRFKTLPATTPRERLTSALPMLLAAGLLLALAGWPFWLTDVPFRLEFAYDRFTLPFIFGTCLLWAVLLWLIPWRGLGWLALAGLVALGAAGQIQAGLLFRQDWANQQRFFWQLSARVPALSPGTVVIANENRATAFSTDNSLSAPLNWIYDPSNHSQTIRYLLVYPTIRDYEGSSFKLRPNWPVAEDLLIGSFSGSTARSISIFFDGSACLRVIDPLLDRFNPLIPEALRQSAAFGDLALITTQDPFTPPLAHILGLPAPNNWCQTYETADLWRQQGRWYDIMELWQAQAPQFEQSTFAGEAAPFVAAYAHSGQWQQASELTPDAPEARGVLCALWQQLDQTAPPGPLKAPAVAQTMSRLRCSEFGLNPPPP